MKNLVGCILTLALFHFYAASPTTDIIAGTAMQIDKFPGTCPHITSDQQGNPVISWIRSTTDTSWAFCYARSVDGGQTFSSPVIIPGTSNIQPHAENLPKVVFKPSGEIIAIWGASNPNTKNKYAGKIYYTQSFDEGRSWTERKSLVNDTAGFDQRYFDVALTPTGEAAMIWLDNRKTKKAEGSGLYFAITEGSNGFAAERLISESCCQCCRTDLFIDSKSGIHVLYRGIVRDSIRDMVHAVSVDNGKTFSEPSRISDDNWVINGCPHTGPAMTENENGLHFAWFTGGKNKGCYYSSSSDNGDTFAPRDSVSRSGSHPQITSFPNGRLLIGWDEVARKGDNFYKRIGLEIRNADGTGSKKSYITPDSLSASYPVLATLGNDKSLLAYTVFRADKSFIEFQLVRVP